MKQQTTTEWLEDYLEKRGAIAEVGPEFYESFLKLSDKKFRSLIRLMIDAAAKEINRMLFDEKGRYKDADILRFIQNMLALMFVGVLRFDDDMKLCMYKTQGPKPTPEVKRLLDERVDAAVPLIRRAFVEVVNRQTSLGRKR